MQLFIRALTLAFVLVTGLAGCGGSGSGGDGAVDTPAVANTLMVSRSITGAVTATANGGSRNFVLGFNSSDSKPISNLQVSGLSTLPAGWSGAANFSCATVGSGNGCLLNLTYAPAAIASGTFTLTYTYTNSVGESVAGSIDIAFAATVSNNVVATTSLAGQVAVVINSQQPISQQTILVTFTPDDGNPASALSITSGLPSDWASTVDFTCATVTADGSCRMMLAYTPTTPGSGTLVLDYSYLDNSGVAKTGTLNIPYVATNANNVVATASPSATIDTYAGDAPQSLTLTFTTDDGSPASALSQTSLLPTGWTGTPGFSCSIVGSGNSCQLTLAYQSLVAASGTFSVAYGYTDNSGAAKTGSINIAYSAKARRAYVASMSGNVDYCAISGVDGSLGTCAATAAGIGNPSGLVFHGDKAYVSDSGPGVYVCDVGTDGSLSACAITGSGFLQPFMLASTATHLYAVNAASSDLTYCSFAVDGSLANCAQISAMLNVPGTIAFNNDIAYITDILSQTMTTCAVSTTTGQFSNCAVNSASGFDQPMGIAFADEYVYVANMGNNTVSSCAINSDGTLGTCSNVSVGNGTSSIAIIGDRAYVTSLYDNSVAICALSRTTGVLSSCVDSGAGTAFTMPMQIRIR